MNVSSKEKGSINSFLPMKEINTWVKVKKNLIIIKKIRVSARHRKRTKKIE